jgi:imidazolonepropionase
MQQADLLITNTAQVVTVAGHGRPKRRKEMTNLECIPNGAVAAMQGKIVWTGPETELQSHVSMVPGSREIDADGAAVLPGLVDCHTHLVFAGTREDEFAQKIAGVPYMEIAARGGGIKRTVRSTRAATLETLVNEGRKRIRNSLLFGVTSVEIKSGYGLDMDTEYKMLRAAGHLQDEFDMELPRTFLGAHEIPPGRDRNDYLEELCSVMIPYVAREKLAEFCDVFCEKGVYTEDEARKVLTTGLKYGLKPKIHADQMTSGNGTRLAAELHAISADHLDYISEANTEALVSSGTIGVLLPGAVFFLGLKQYPPVRKLIESGLPVAISTDFNPGSCMTQNLHMIMTIACTRCRMTIEEAITACTLNAAFAEDRGHVCGSIEPGKRADLVILDTPHYETLPYHFGHNHVRKVICGGKLVVDEFTYIDAS